jgi:hypothetical protein
MPRFWATSRPLSAGRSVAGGGVPGPSVAVRVVDHLDRQATGKMRRFLPLAAAEPARMPTHTGSAR